MGPGGKAADAERQRRVADALARPKEARAVFGAMLASWIWMDQRYRLGDDRYAQQEDYDRHGAALLLALSGTRDPAALRLMLAYELDQIGSAPQAPEAALLAAGRRWHQAEPRHFELRRGLALALAISKESKHWPEGDRMVGDLSRDHPEDLILRLFPLRIQRARFQATQDPAYGRRALALIAEARRAVPPRTSLADKTLRFYERSIRSEFTRLGLKP